MTIQVTPDVTRTMNVVTREFSGELEGTELFRYGQAGMLHPQDYHLTICVRTEGKRKPLTSYTLRLGAKKPHTSFTANFGFPIVGTISSYDYGHGFGGYIKDAPIEILEAIRDATGIDLTGIGI